MQVLVEELRKNDRQVTNSQGHITGTLESYILTVLPKDVLAVMRAVALDELDQQQQIGNKPSQIIVDNVSVAKRGIDEAKRHIKMRFGDIDLLIEAAKEAFRIVTSVTRIQMPARDGIVARRSFHLFIDGRDAGLLPGAISRLNANTVTQDTVIRIVGPLVPYARKLFWNPVGTARVMKFRQRSNRGRGTMRYLNMPGASKFAPKFKPYAPSTVKKLMRGTSVQAAKIRALVGSKTPPGRTENAGLIAKRILRAQASYRSLYFSDGWINYEPARGWSKLNDPRVPSISIQFSKRGATNI